MEIYDEDTLTEYEIKRQRNIISNYEFMKSCGLPVKPLIYVKNKSPNDMPEEEEFIPPNSDDEDDTWFPNESEAKKFNQIEEKKLESTNKHKPIFKKVRNPCALFGLPKPDVGDKNKVPTKRKSKEGTEEVSSKSILKRPKINPIRQRRSKETGISTIVKDDQENQPVNRYPKRKQRIDYREAEVPDDDHYLYCEECEDFNHGDCPIHGPLVPVEDNKVDEAMLTVETKARASLPSALKIKSSSIPHAGLGVFAGEEIEPGVRFGPYQGKKVQKGSARDGRDTSYMWEIMRDGDVHYYIDGKDENVGNWLRFINCARNEVEQNLVAYQYYNEIYYRAYKKIGVGKELLVWYGDDYAKDLGIEDSVDTNEENWNQQLKSQTQRCEFCKKLFDVKFFPSHEKWCRSRNTGLENKRGRHCDMDNKGCDTKEIPFKCSTCGKGFAMPSKLRNHEMIHTGEKPYECTTCGKGFARSNSLKIHELTHTGDWPYECTTCGRGFSASVHLKIHELTHTGERPFKCITCGKRFAQSSNLKTHELTHTGEKPFKCTICGKRFAQSSNLKTHELTHTGEKPYECTTCGKRFAQSSNLKTHEQMMH